MKRRRKQEEVDFEAGWAVGWHRSRFKSLVNDPEFQGLVTLARLGNMLRFVYSVSIRSKGKGPELRRQQMNSFYLSGALLVATEQTLHKLGHLFKGDPEYVTLVKSVTAKESQSVLRRFRKLRNQSGFHFDEQPVGPALRKIAARRRPFVAFLTAYGTVSKDMYYDLGDEVAMELLLGEDEYGEWLKDWMSQSGDTLNRIFDALEHFISGRLVALSPDKKTTVEDRPDDLEETKRIAAEVQGAKSS